MILVPVGLWQVTIEIKTFRNREYKFDIEDKRLSEKENKFREDLLVLPFDQF